MERIIGRSAYGIRLPLKVDFDRLQDEIINNLLKASQSPVSGFYIPKKGGILGVTESLVARGQKNYVTKQALADDMENKLIDGDLVLFFPILSRNRFLPILEAIAKINRKITIVLKAVRDEMGNPLAPDVLFWEETAPVTAEEFETKYGKSIHPYTKIDYIDLYKNVREGIDIVVTDNPGHAGDFGENIVICTTHSRFAYKKFLCEKYPDKNILTLSDICTTPNVEGQGYNPEYGVLGANMADGDRIKLFPHDSFEFTEQLQKKILNETGKLVEVLIFGDGAYKDPVQQIWELADPVTCPGYTKGLLGTPKEIKLKYFIDNYKGDQVDSYIADTMTSESTNGGHSSLGTTPRHLIDLIASMCDLVTGSGDTGTPVVYINGYFDKYFDGFPEE